jgi:hypothetical protein
MGNEVNPASEEIFRFPKGFKGGYLFVAILLLGPALALFALLVGSSPGSLNRFQKILVIIVSLVAMPFGWYFAWVASLANDRIQVSGAGITYVPKKGQRTFLPWVNISEIRERVRLGRLELYDGRGQKAMDLHYQLENFERLWEVLRENTGHVRKQKAFHRHAAYYAFYIFVILAIGIIAWFSLNKTESFPDIRYAGFTIYGLLALLAIIALLKDTRKVDIEPRKVTLAYLLWKRTIPYSEISDVFLQNVISGSDPINPTVSIKQHNGKTFKLMGFKDGGVLLFDALRSAWETIVGKQGRDGILSGTSHHPKVFHQSSENIKEWVRGYYVWLAMINCFWILLCIVYWIFSRDIASKKISLTLFGLLPSVGATVAFVILMEMGRNRSRYRNFYILATDDYIEAGVGSNSYKKIFYRYVRQVIVDMSRCGQIRHIELRTAFDKVSIPVIDQMNLLLEEIENHLDSKLIVQRRPASIFSPYYW